ncbi:muellerian-inhibiting factor [Emydura macquarii macquarii]|uniref:muellerian-inhibiting factor n=1 Tax=Emydura macquarii macquarii TaxID=1129001 RepID=UPI003529D7D7
MRPVLGMALQCLLLLLPSTALPRKGGVGEGVSPAEELKITFPKELGLGEEQREKEDESIYEGPDPNFMASKSKATAATHLILKRDSPGDDSNGAKCQQLIPEEVEAFPDLGSDSSFHAWPMDGLEGPVCTVKMDRRNSLGQSQLEVVGVLTSYESDFLQVVRHSSWDEGHLETFGICPTGGGHAALLSLKHIQAHLADPGENRFLVLHLEEVKWDAETKLRFKLPFQEDVGRSLGKLQVALLVFYPGSRERKGSKGREKLLASGDGLHPKQAFCLFRDTRYLLLGASVTSAVRAHRQLSFDISLAIRRHGDGGSLLPPAEARQLLFGTDEKRFTRMTPALLLLAKLRCEDALSPSSFLPVGGVVETAPYPQPSSLAPDGRVEEPASDAATSQANASSPAPASRDQFLGSLTRFISRVLSPSEEPPAASGLHHWLDFKTMETLPHQLLNLSEGAALERLVQSEEPLVLLFPQDSQALLEQQFGHWRLEGSLLQLLLEKLQNIIQELREIPAFQANAGLFQQLLAFCYYPLGFPLGPGSHDPAELPQGPRKLRTLLLLKALQTVRAHWQEKRKVSRQNRSAGPRAYCRLQELTVDLRYEKVIVPERYMAKNCEGPCQLPLSTRISDYFAHTVLLMEMQERGTPLRRSPCCVPVKYSDREFISISEAGMQVRTFPNMVAEECGCR